jgi:hypothetical protein
MTLDRDAQSKRAAGGNEFEKIVAKILNEFMVTDNIVVTRARESVLSSLIHNKVNLRDILDFTKIPVKRRCDQTQLQDYPDLDLFALTKPTEDEQLWRLLAILSCKVSFHARHTESAFWGLLVRLTSRIPYVVITEDRDIYKPKTSELGASCKGSTVTRRLLESFADRVYLVKRYNSENDPKLLSDIALKHNTLADDSLTPVFDDPTIPRHTKYCNSVRPLDDLFDDLRRWRLEIPR